MKPTSFISAAVLTVALSYLAPALPAASQGAPAAQQGQTQVFGAWTKIGRAPDLNSGTSSARVALGSVGQVARVCNTSSTIPAYVQLGNSTVAATLAGGDLVPPNTCISMNAVGATYIAGITASSNALLQTTLGTGAPLSSTVPGSGGGGGAVTSVFARTGAVVANPGDYSALTVLSIGAGSAITSSGPGGALTALAYTTPATGIAAWLAAPTSANLAAAVTDETGTGALVFAGAPALTGAVTASGSIAIGGATIGTDALGITGTGTISGTWNAGGVNVTAATIPTNGVYLSAPNTLDFSTSGTKRLEISTSAIVASVSVVANNASGFGLQNVTSSATVPTLSPNRSNINDGIGSSGSGLVNIISASLTRAQFGTNAASVSDVLLPGALFTGGNGTTTFPQFYINATGTTAPTTLSTSGTYIGVNAVSGFGGNFADFHVAGAASVFKVDSQGNITNGGSITMAGGAGLFFGGRGLITSPSTAQVQLGSTDAAAPVAQTLRVQSVVAGNANTAGANWTITGSLSNGSGGSAGNGGDILIQTTASVASSGSQNSAVTAIRVLSGTQEVRLPAIASDAGLTDTSVCQDTTNHGLHSGSGTLGVCLGTSSARYKHDITPLTAGLAEVMAIQPVQYRLNANHGDPNKLLYGFTAEQGGSIIPVLMGEDGSGQPNTFDYLGMVPVLTRAVQELKADNDNLRHEILDLRRASGAR